jgi:hypothetical protein
MIQYSKMTLRRVVDDVMIRLNKHRSAVNMDWDTVIRAVNHSVKEVASLIMPYDGESFIRRMDVVNGTSMPREFVRRSRLLVERETDVYDEARYVDIKEYFNLTNSINVHDFNHSYDYAGIYAFWGEEATSTATDFRIHIHPVTLTGVLDYYAMPVLLTAETDVVPIPEEYMEIVIFSAMQRIYARTAQHSQITEVQKRMAMERQKIYELYINKRKQEDRELDSFVEPVIPLVGTRPSEGEVPKKL